MNFKCIIIVTSFLQLKVPKRRITLRMRNALFASQPPEPSQKGTKDITYLCVWLPRLAAYQTACHSGTKAICKLSLYKKQKLFLLR